MATPNVGGAGFMDIMTRSDLHDVTERIFIETFGPRVIGCFGTARFSTGEA